MNWNNLPGAKCVLLRYQLRSVNPVHRALVFAFTPIKCKSKERKIKQLLEGYPNFILRILLLLFVFGHILSCFFFLLKCCWSAEMLISSLSGQLKDFQFIFAYHLLKKDWIFFFCQQRNPLVSQKQQLHHCRDAQQLHTSVTLYLLQDIRTDCSL